MPELAAATPLAQAEFYAQIAPALRILLDVVRNTAMQMASLLAVLLFGALVLTLLSRWTDNVFRQFLLPKFGLYVFGVIGVPVHEFSHALFCKLFGHKIERVKWFDAAGEGGCHGAVVHQFNPGNIIHQIGRFFIGLGPCLLGPALILGLLYLLLPEARPHLAGAVSADMKPAWLASTQVLKQVFAIETLTSPRHLVFLYLAMAISSQLELSPEDLSGALRGFVPIAGVLVVINLLIRLLHPRLHEDVVTAGWNLTTWLAPPLALTAVLSFLNFCIAFLFMNIGNRLCGRASINPFRA